MRRVIARRTFLAVAAGATTSASLALSRLDSHELAYYVSDGSVLLHYDVDIARAALTRRSSIDLPAAVQYAWPHALQPVLYVACSDMAGRHYVGALKIDSSGELSTLGKWVRLPDRPIHTSTDIPSENLLVAFNDPSAVRVFAVNRDFSVGREIPQTGVRDGGFFAHQIRVTPDNRHAILVTRGNSAAGGKAEDPGALKVFDYQHGVLSHEVSIAPNGGIGFGPRHLDFHPVMPLAYVSLERENKLLVYRLEHGTIAADAIFEKGTLAYPDGAANPRQLAAAIHVHPNGRYVYVSNRNDTTVDFDGRKVLGPGENTITVFAINQTTGEPTAIQFIDTHKVDPRTFALDPMGVFMTVQHIIPMPVRDGDHVKTNPAGVTTFRVGADGKLTYVSSYDLDTEGGSQIFWGKIIRL